MAAAPRKSSGTGVLGAHLEAVRARLDTIDLTLGKVTVALEALVRLEERHASLQRDQDDLKKRVDGHDGQIESIENKLPSALEVRAWIIGGAFGLIGIITTAFLTGHLKVAF